ncbi:MAG TPA: phage tail protein [Kofleriaceae bacterium]|nr:phage tail protein [Kofleriaceae bacterium]
MTTSNPNRAYSAAHFALELDNNQQVGLFRSIEGGSIKADVMTYQNGTNYDRWRQLGKPKFEDIKIQTGMSMSEPFYQWIEKFFTGVPDRKNGAIVAADFNYKERARREFKEALIKELTFPKLDGQDKNAAYMTLALSVEEIVFLPGKGGTLSPAAGTEKQKLWASCNFSFTLDGFEAACKRVTKIDSFTIKQNIIEYHTGTQRAPIKTPSQIEFPQITFYVPEADAQPFLDRFKERGVAGKVRASSSNKAGELIVFDADVNKNELFSLQFYGADILNVQPDKADASTEEIKQVKIDLYTERMEFKYLSK